MIEQEPLYVNIKEQYQNLLNSINATLVYYGEPKVIILKKDFNKKDSEQNKNCDFKMFTAKIVDFSEAYKKELSAFHNRKPEDYQANPVKAVPKPLNNQVQPSMQHAPSSSKRKNLFDQNVQRDKAFGKLADSKLLEKARNQEPDRHADVETDESKKEWDS